MTYFAIQELPAKKPAAGIEMRVIHGERMTFAYFTFTPGTPLSTSDPTTRPARSFSSSRESRSQTNPENSLIQPRAGSTMSSVS
jgi:hypothetical protein